MKYLTIKELKELIKDLPDDERIYFSIPKEQDELFWRDTALVRTGEVKENTLYLEGKPTTWKEDYEEIDGSSSQPPLSEVTHSCILSINTFNCSG
jgi:hypothetical protein